MRKSKIITAIIIGLILISGTQIYAAQVLDTNIIGLMADAVETIKDEYIQDTQQNDKDLEAIVDQAIQGYISGKADYIDDSLNTHYESEVEKINQYVDNYINDYISELDVVVEEELETAKEEITQEFIEDTDKLKNKIEQKLIQEINKQIKADKEGE